MAPHFILDHYIEIYLDVCRKSDMGISSDYFVSITFQLFSKIAQLVQSNAKHVIVETFWIRHVYHNDDL